MIPIGFAWFLVAMHISSCLCCIPLFWACYRRIAAGKNLNAVSISVITATTILVIFHTLQVVTVFLNVLGKTELKVYVDDWIGLIDQYWCAFDSLATMFCSMSMLFMGLVMAYVPFAVFLSARYKTRFPLVDSPPRILFPSTVLCVIGIPMLLIVAYLVVTNNSPINTRFTLSDWHCSLNYYHNPWYFYIVAIMEFIASLLTIIMVGYSAHFMISFRKEAIRLCGESNIGEDMIIRSFLLGGSCLLADLLIGIDTVLNLMNPTLGIYNGVPYVIMFLMASLGQLSLLIWGTTPDLLPYVPWIRPQLERMQELMKEFLRLTDPEDLKLAVQGGSVVLNTPSKLKSESDILKASEGEKKINTNSKHGNITNTHSIDDA